MRVYGADLDANQREQLEAALEYARDGDVLVVTKLDRLARSVPHLCEIGSRLDAKGVGLKVLDQAIDSTTPTGRLMFNMLGTIAAFTDRAPSRDQPHVCLQDPDCLNPARQS